MSTPTCRKEGSSIPVTPVLLVRSGPQKHSAAKRGSYNQSPLPAGCTHSSHGLSTHFCPSLSRSNTQSSQAGPRHGGSAALQPPSKTALLQDSLFLRRVPHSPIQEQLPREGLAVLGRTVQLTWPLHSRASRAPGTARPFTGPRPWSRTAAQASSLSSRCEQGHPSPRNHDFTRRKSSTLSRCAVKLLKRTPLTQLLRSPPSWSFPPPEESFLGDPPKPLLSYCDTLAGGHRGREHPGLGDAYLAKHKASSFPVLLRAHDPY